MNENFASWLASGTLEPYYFQLEEWAYTVIRVKKDDNFDYLYSKASCQTGETTRTDAFKYAGIYYKNDGQIYDAYSAYLPGEADGFKGISNTFSEALREQLEKSVREKVEATIGNDRKNLKVSELSNELLQKLNNKLSHNIPNNARKRFLNEDAPGACEYHCDYKAREWTDATLCSYIADPDIYAAKEAEEFINTQQENILYNFLYEDEVRKAYDELANNPDNAVHATRKIMAAMKDSPAKTVNVTVRKHGAEITFKAVARDFGQDYEYGYSTLNIEAAGRRKFMQTFGHQSRYYPQDIVRITYGKKVLYEATK